MNSLTQHSDIQKLRPVKSRVKSRPANKPTRHMNHAGFDLDLDLDLDLDSASSLDDRSRHGAYPFAQNPMGASLQPTPNGPKAGGKSLELFAALQQEFWESARLYTQQAADLEHDNNPVWRVQRQCREATMVQSLQMQEQLLTRLLQYAQACTVPRLPTSLANLATQLSTEKADQAGPSMREAHPEVATELESLRMMVSQDHQQDMCQDESAYSSGSDSDAPSTDTVDEPVMDFAPKPPSRQAASDEGLRLDDMDFDLVNFFQEMPGPQPVTTTFR